MAYILATDLDMTLVGNDEALAKLNIQLTKLRIQKELNLVYVTGRSQELYKTLETEKGLLKPDALITAVGTEIYDGDGSMLKDWPKAANWNRPGIENLLSSFPELVKQPDSEQRPHKISYYLEADNETYGRVRERLQNLEVEVVYSMDQYLDILPQGVNKGSALLYLASTWGILEANIVTCGDSENDISMLTVGKAILVGNAKAHLKDWAGKQDSRSIYLAKADCAAGIEDGLEHWGLL
jgi:hypothetical protein